MEEDHLLGNPWAEQPEPMDWEVRPTYPVHKVPYSLASLWDKRQAEARARWENEPRSPPADPVGKIPKELKQKLKKAKGAKTLLQELEESVRGFVQQWEDKKVQLRSEGLADVDSSDEEDIVFVGRNGRTREKQAEKAEEQLARDQLIFHSLVDDHGAAFGSVLIVDSTWFLGGSVLTPSRRWLVHSIAAYYNLRTWSVTRGDPARREAYVGIKDKAAEAGSQTDRELPRPLWVLV